MLTVVGRENEKMFSCILLPVLRHRKRMRKKGRRREEKKGIKKRCFYSFRWHLCVDRTPHKVFLTSCRSAVFFPLDTSELRGNSLKINNIIRNLMSQQNYSFNFSSAGTGSNIHYPNVDPNPEAGGVDDPQVKRDDSNLFVCYVISSNDE